MALLGVRVLGARSLYRKMKIRDYHEHNRGRFVEFISIVTIYLLTHHFMWSQDCTSAPGPSP